MVLLLQAGNDIEDRVHVVWCPCHGEASGAARAAVDQEIVLWQGHVHAGEHECDRGDGDRDIITRVESA